MSQQQQPGESGEEIQPYRIRVSKEVPHPATEELTDESIIHLDIEQVSRHHATKAGAYSAAA
jgi:hypothetical protein